ncbi:MAG: right-handed parallel beta-helix repeat-containing protein [Lysobacteraceae bacterium]
MVLAGILVMWAESSIAAGFTVTSSADVSDSNVGDGVCMNLSVTACTLRAAIEESNATAFGLDEISFNVTAMGTSTITVLGSPLPTITSPMIINATTASGYNSAATDIANAPPRVYLDGQFLGGSDADGLRVFESGSNAFLSVRALGIINFPDNGIELDNNARLDADRCWIGVTATGTAAGNDGDGIRLSLPDGSIIGRRSIPESQPDEGRLGNIISNNGEHGIYVLGGDGVVIGGNRIGTSPDGSSAAGNGGSGIHLDGPNSIIGNRNSDTALGNTINWNAVDGIYSFAGGQQIRGNTIIGNGGAGLNLNGGNVVGADGNHGNLIADNGSDGIRLGEITAAGTEVRHNLISGNGGRGIHVLNGDNVLIHGNSLVANDADGLRFDADNGTVSENDIGALGVIPGGNAFNGIALFGSGNTVTGNRVYFGLDDGIDVFDGDGNHIDGNWVGVNPPGDEVGNSAAGIRVRGAASNTLIENNLVGNNEYGVVLQGGGTSVCGNQIGAGLSINSAGGSGNTLDGVYVTGANNIIGFELAGCPGNVISGNERHGLIIGGLGADGNTVFDNRIGGRPGGAVGHGNAHHGVLILLNAAANFVQRNDLQYNLGGGIALSASAGVNNTLYANHFFENAGLAVDLGDDGVTANDAGDVDEGPNRLQNTPAITALLATGPGVLQVTLHLDTAAATFPVQIHFYVNDDGGNDAEWIATEMYGGPSGTNDDVVISVPYSSGWLMVQATEVGNSSELSAPMPFGTPPIPEPDVFKDGFED